MTGRTRWPDRAEGAGAVPAIIQLVLDHPPPTPGGLLGLCAPVVLIFATVGLIVFVRRMD